MSRVARSAHLQVTVDDKELSDHLARVKAAQTAWGSLGAAASAFSKTDWSRVTASLQEIGRAAHGLDLAKFVTFGKMLAYGGKETENYQSLANSLWDIAKAVSAAVVPASDLAEALTKGANASYGLKAVRTALTQMNTRLARIQPNAAGLMDTGLLQQLEKMGTLQVAAKKAARDLGVEIEKAGKKARSTALSLQQLYRTISVSIFIVAHQLRYIGEQINKGAQLADLENVMRRNQEGFARIMRETREATRGMVTDLQILKSAALMSSFKIPIENLARNMELISKLAVRTGQDQEYLFDSFARGVARLSPAILDNLGLQIKLEDAYERYATAAGIATGAMDAQAKKLAVLNEVVRQAEDLTAEIDPAASLAARFAKLDATWSNWFNKLWAGVARSIGFLSASSSELAGIASDKLAIYVKEMKELGSSSIALDDMVVAVDAAKQKWLELDIEVRTVLRSATTGNLELARALVMQEYIAKGLIKDFRNLTVEQAEAEKKILQERERTLRMYPVLLEEIREAQKSLEDWQQYVRIQRSLEREAADALDEVESRNYKIDIAVTGIDAITEASEKLSVLLPVYNSLESGYKRIAEVRAQGKKFTSDDIALQKAYQEILEQEVRTVEQRLNTYRLQAEQGNIAIRTFLAVYDTARMLNGIEAHSLKLAEDRVAKYKEENALLIAQLDIIKDEVKIELAALEGRSPALQAQVDAEEALARARTKYNELLEKSAVATSGVGEVTNEQIKAQQTLVLKAIEKAKAAKEYAELEQWILKAMDDQSFKSQETLQAERELIWAGRSRLQMEADIVRNKGIIKTMLDAQLERERKILALKKEGTVHAMAEAAMLAFQQGASQALLFDIMEKTKKWIESMNRIPRSGGAGPSEPRASWRYDIEERVEFEIRRVRDGLQIQRKDIKEHYEYINDLQNFIASESKTAWDKMFGPARFVSTSNELEKMLGDFFKIKIHVEEGEKQIKALTEAYEEMVKEGAEADKIAAVLQLRDAWMAATEAVRQHVTEITKLTVGMTHYAQATEWAFKHSQDLLGEDVIRSMGDLATNVEALGNTIGRAMEGQADGYAVMGSGLNIVRSFTNEYIKDLRKRAAVEMLMNAAMAWAAFPNVPRMIAHGTAATMFGLVAGGVVRLPGAARGDDKEQGKRSSSPLHIHLYSEMAMTDAERGALVDRAIAQARAEGRI